MATPTSPSVFHVSSNFNLNPAINAGPRYWGCHRLNVRYRMKKPQLLLVCILPVLLLGAFYVCRLGFHMHDAHLAGMLMILIGAALSVLTPTVFLLLRIFSKDRFPLGASFVFSCLAGVIYWAVCYLDFGSQLHQFIAA